MAGSNDMDMVAVVWQAVGVIGALIFFGRFYLQWIVSEMQRRSVVPVAFWYMSSAGSLLLLAYGVFLGSPLGVLSYSFNMIVYSRNLIHIWRGNGELTRFRSTAVHLAVALIILVALALVAHTWWRFGSSEEGSAKNWFWLGIGLAGQACFGARFLLQWLVTEAKRKSVVPVAFWYISIVAAVLMTAAYAQRAEWIYAVGLATTLVVYARNLWLIHTRGDVPAPDIE